MTRHYNFDIINLREEITPRLKIFIPIRKNEKRNINSLQYYLYLRGI